MKKFRIATCQISRIRRVLAEVPGAIPFDITVKSEDQVFAPSWKIVMGYKNGNLSGTEYLRIYKEIRN